jgi:predicted GIY-YIG superfamily endonuclease
MPCGYVYLLRDRDRSQFKIGKTKDRLRRIDQHRSSNPNLEVVWVEEFDSESEAFHAENFLKKQLCQWRIHRKEWFSREPTDAERAAAREAAAANDVHIESRRDAIRTWAEKMVDEGRAFFDDTSWKRCPSYWDEEE